MIITFGFVLYAHIKTLKEKKKNIILWLKECRSCTYPGLTTQGRERHPEGKFQLLTQTLAHQKTRRFLLVLYIVKGKKTLPF